MKVFLTFASSSMVGSVKRISKQAKAINFYDKILACTESDLSADFRQRHEDRLVEGSRGYGYWCWKPQIIFQTLEKMQCGDILQYTDAGCHINPKGLARLREYFEIVEKSSNGILAFQLKDPEYPLLRPTIGELDLAEYKWVKGDLLDCFGVRHSFGVTHSQAIGAGIIFIRKCVSSVALIKQWCEVVESDFSLIDDSPSVSPNLAGFIEHRHDQAIFSLICKKNAVETLSAYEYWYPSSKKVGPDWRVLADYPIHARRDKDFGLIVNVKNFGKRVLSKIRRVVLVVLQAR